MKIDIQVPVIEIGLFGIRINREDGFLYIRVYLLNVMSTSNDCCQSLLEVWYDEEAAANYPDNSSHYEFHLFWMRIKGRFGPKKLKHLAEMVDREPNAEQS